MKSTLSSLLLSGRSSAGLLALALLTACAGGETATTTETNVAACGDGISARLEECDDGNTEDGDGCNAICEVEAGFVCTGDPSSCTASSGGDTGVETDTGTTDTGADTAPDTTIDDTGADTAPDTTVDDTTPDTTADTAVDDTTDTTPDTTVEDTTDTTVDDTTADTAPDTTVDTTPDTTPPPVCGDGTVATGEACDDGNLTDGDGCSDLCVVEPRYACSGSPSICVINLCAGVSCAGLAGTCEVATCNPATGLCEVRDDADGTACSDGNLCTTGDVCTAGLCGGAPVVCADSGGGCTTGICNPGTGACEGVAQPDCTACAGGGFCAGGECGGLPQTPAYTFESATDAAAFAMSGNQPWRIDTTTARTGAGSLRSGAIGNSQTSTATLTVNLRAAAQLRVWVKASSESCCDKLSLRLNGALDATTWAGTVNWTEVVRNLPAGPSTLAFTYTKDSTTVAGSDAVWLDDLTISAETTDSCSTGTCGEAIFNGTDCLVCAPVSDGTTCDTDASDCTAESCQAGSCVAAPIADGTSCETGTECTVGSCAAGACVTATAPDCTACGTGGLCGGGTCQGAAESTSYAYGAGSTLAPFTTSAPAWALDASQGNSPGGALKSGTTPNNGSSVLTFTTSGASRTYAFWYKVSSESTFDYLTLKLDGVQVQRWSGEVAWTRYTGTIPAGSHTLTLTYSKDGSGTSGSDAAWIDDVEFSDPNNCAGDICGTGVSSGGACVTCEPAPNGTACDSDASPCTAQTCQAGSCVAEPVVDGTSCDSDATDCTVESCQAGACVPGNAPDCADCGATGTGTCGDGTCFGPDEAQNYSYGTGATLAPFTTGATAWRIDAAEGRSAGGALRAGVTPDSGSSVLTYTHTGPARPYSFWYKVSSELNYDYLTLKLDGVSLAQWSGTVAWTQYSGTIPAGSHTLTLTYAKDVSGTSGSDTAWVDDVSFAQPNSCASDLCSSGVPVGGACFACFVQPDGTDCDASPTDCAASSCQSGACVAANEEDCTTCGTTGTGICGNGTCFGPDEFALNTSFPAGSALAPLVSTVPAWAIDTTQGYTGGSALKSGPTPSSGASSVSLALTGTAKTVSFWYKVSSEQGYDFLRFKVDGVTRGEWSGAGVWTRFTANLTAGNHTLLWEYSKDGSSSLGSDAGWIDDLTIGTPNLCGDECSLSVDSGAGCVACAAPAADCTACNGGTEVCVAGNCGGLGNTSVVETFESATWPAAFTTTSATPWSSSATVPAPGAGQGLRSAKSGNIGGSTSTAFQRTFTVGAGGSLAFKYRVSSESGYDFLKVTVDGTEVLSASGTVGWTDFTRALTAGNRTVVWTYSKDASGIGGSDAAWVDLITVTDATSCAGDSCGNAGYDGGACLTCDATACY